MKIIGVTGSIGMGKTTISSMLRLVGIPIFDSDKYVRTILEENNCVIEKIFRLWPDTVSIIQKKKKINKHLLGEKVFKSRKNRKILENIIHPIVQKQRDIFIHNHKKSKIIGLDVPLLYETGTDKICDYIFLVNALKNIQRKRVLARPNMTEEKFKQINNAQWTFEQKKKNETIYNKYIIW
tara:strand:- start:517 stop:1059 length:543 start_codon:yes stop_codon:yes gene_type:complete